MAPRILIAAVAIALTLGPARAQATPEADAKGYPNRAIRIIVPFPPGGPADTITRLVGQRMGDDWGQPVVIENRAGGNTAIGAQAAARAAADGYTLLAAMDTIDKPVVNSNQAVLWGCVKRLKSALAPLPAMPRLGRLMRHMDA
jgi:tripartite-type tricarboxylate transporter receptor subunit TctC